MLLSLFKSYFFYKKANKYRKELREIRGWQIKNGKIVAVPFGADTDLYNEHVCRTYKTRMRREARRAKELYEYSHRLAKLPILGKLSTGSGAPRDWRHKIADTVPGGYTVIPHIGANNNYPITERAQRKEAYFLWETVEKYWKRREESGPLSKSEQAEKVLHDCPEWYWKQAFKNLLDCNRLRIVRDSHGTP
jgi:hypothetical protein